MASFLLQKKSGCLDNEERFLENELKHSRYMHTYRKITLDELDYIEEQGLIPVGTIQFVTKYLSKNYGIDSENPIEIPKYLRTDEFLKRDYKIVTWDKIPRTGIHFIKDVSELKSFGQVLNTSFYSIDDLFNYIKTSEFDATLVLNKEHLFQVSSVIPISAEYRVYVIDGDIENICNYNGDVTVLPDIDLIKKAVSLIKLNEKWLKSFTLDIAVNREGTSILEVHNFTSVGLYSTQWGSSLPYAYRDGIDYLINDNKVIEI